VTVPGPPPAGGDGGVARIVTADPGPALRALVGRYIGYRERPGTGVVARHEPAGAYAVLILGWGAPLDVSDPRAADRGARGVSSFVAGTFDGPAVTRGAGAGEGIQLYLPPLVARRLLGTPMSDLANRAVSLDALPSDWLERLSDRLAGAVGWSARFALLDRALRDRLAGTDPVDARLRLAWRRLADAHGRIGVDDLATELGWSRRHLSVRFRTEVGLPPKTVARLLRFQRAQALAQRAGRRWDGWARLAAECGYHDQSHLIRDVRAFTGSTPTALRASTGTTR
jgi:AraC-like DNA-binding protein